MLEGNLAQVDDRSLRRLDGRLGVTGPPRLGPEDLEDDADPKRCHGAPSMPGGGTRMRCGRYSPSSMRSRLEQSAVLAWAAVGVWAYFVWSLGGDEFSRESTSSWIDLLVRWLVPGASAETLDAANWWLRQSAHLFVYGVLAVLGLRAWMLSTLRPIQSSIWLAMALVLALAAADESRQSLSALRSGSIDDLGMDLAGGCLALCLALSLPAALRHRLFPRREST
jgi:VanZ family protein